MNLRIDQFQQRFAQCEVYALPLLELLKLSALQQHLKGGPEWRSGCKCAVHVDCTVREARPDRLIDVDHWVVRKMRRCLWRKVIDRQTHYY